MNIQDCIDPSTGKIVRGLSGHDAFTPARPPAEPLWSPGLTSALSRADGILGELSGIGRLLPAPELLIRSYVEREAVLSSRIEGTRASLDDVLRPEADHAGARQERDVLEVRNYVAAMDHGLAARARRPVISLNLVLELHQVLMTGIPGERGSNALPGRFRTSQNWIGRPGGIPASAIYIPPPPEHLHECRADWERFINEPSPLPDLVRCALMHKHFESIHPFNDGNGRIGRLLVTMFLIERGRISRPLLYLSEYIEANRREYYRGLQGVRTRGDWTNWLLYFLDSVAVTAHHALDQTTRRPD